jgi:hypothetical protein
MTQSPFDQLAKQYLEDFLTPIGAVERQYEIPGETKYVDVWFTPNLPITASIDDLGLLREIAKSPALIEPYSNPPSRDDLDACLLKRLWIKEDERRKRGDDPYPESEQPMLWVLASRISRPLLKDFFARKTRRVAGLYTLGPGQRTMLVAIDQLPQTPNTLWLRILGRGETQAEAIAELALLPRDHPRRDGILRLFAAWKVRIDLDEVQEFLQQEVAMAYPQVFLDWEEATRQDGIAIGEERAKRELVLRLLNRRCGELMPAVRSRIDGLSLPQLEQLGEDLLDFGGLADLQIWLDRQ